MSQKRKKNTGMRKSSTTATPYDDVFRTMIHDCPELVIGVINELFYMNIPDDAEVTSLKNELFIHRQDKDMMERITDANLLIDNKRFHLECQSTLDNTMILRIFEYDAQIALENSEIVDNHLIVRFPHTAVLYLRHNSNTPDQMRITIDVPGEQINYHVPIMKVQQYTVEKIFEKKLYLLIPFHIFVYEASLEEYESYNEKRKELLDVYEDILRRLNRITEQEIISEYTKRMIIDMSKQVIKHLCLKYKKVKKGVGKIMGGKVLEYEAKTILKKGIKQGIEMHLVTLIHKKLQKGYSSEQIAEVLEEPVELIERLIQENPL